MACNGQCNASLLLLNADQIGIRNDDGDDNTDTDPESKPEPKWIYHYNFITFYFGVTFIAVIKSMKFKVL